MSAYERHARMTRFLTFILLAPLGATGVAGCGEREQAGAYKQGKYQGKPDGRPWDSQPPAYVSGEWTKGDQYSWQKQIRARNDGQNENTRIAH